MAPEMAMGRNQKCTPATDVFLLGAILYEILTGHPPYDAYPRAACMRAAAHLFPALPDDAPEELKAITLQAMARDPADRFSDAGEFGDALERYLSHQEAENQSNRAESKFRSQRDELKRPVTQRRDAPALLTSLIAVADQFRQAGELWQASGGQPGNEPEGDDETRAESTDRSPAESTSKIDEFTTAGIERSRRGECDAREQLVSFAIESGDLALAQSQAEVLAELNSPRANELRTAVSRAQERRQRDRRQRLTAASAALILLVASLVFWQQRTSADARAEKSDSDRVAAESKRQLAEAETEKKAAEVRAAQAETDAVNEKLKREEVEGLAAAERADREQAMAQIAERMAVNADVARFERFWQAQALYSAAALAQRPRLIPNDVPALLELQQAALTPHRTSSRRVMTGSVVLSPDSRWLVSSDLLRPSIRVWSTENWMESFVLEGHQTPDNRGGLWGTVRGFVFDPRDAGVLYSAGMDGTLRAWDLSTREELRRFEPETAADGGKPAGHELMSLTVRPAQDGDAVELVAGKRSGDVLVLNADSLKVVREVKAHQAQVTAVRFNLDGTRLATVASDGTLKVWNADFEELASLTHPEQPDGADPVPLFDVAWSLDGKLLAASGEAETIPVWETETWTLARTLAGHPVSVDGSKRVRELLWLQDDLILSGGADGVIRRWNPQTGEATGALTGHTPSMYGRRGILSLTIDPGNPNRLVSCGRDDSIRVWNLAEGTMTHALEGADIADPQKFIPMPIHSAYVSFTDQLLTTMPSYDAPARLWNAETLREVQRFPQFPDLGENDTDRRVQGLAISPDGQRFVTSELNGNLLFWNTEEPAPVKIIKGHEVTSQSGGPPPSDLIPVAFSPDGKQVVSPSSDGKMRFWNAETFEKISEWDTNDPDMPPEIPDFVKALSGDFRKAFMMRLRQRAMDNTVIYVADNRVLTAGRDGVVRFRDVEQGKIVRRLEHVARIRCATKGCLL
jgi:WD40 repeat protein